MKIDSLIGASGYTPVNKHLARLYGFLEAGWLCEVIRYRERFATDEFPYTIEDMEKEVGIGRKSQIRIKKLFQDNGIISIIKKGNPSKDFFVINDEKLSEIIFEPYQKGNVSSTEMVRLSRTKRGRLLYNKENILNNNKEEDINTTINCSIDSDGISEEKELEKMKKMESNTSFIKKFKSLVESKKFTYNNSKERNWTHLLTNNSEWKKVLEESGLDSEGLMELILKYANDDEFWKGRICGIGTFYYKWTTLLNQMKSKELFDFKRNLSTLAKQTREEQARKFFNI